jgi:hypothetical protein
MKEEMSGTVDQGPKKLEKGAYAGMTASTETKKAFKQEPEEPTVFGAPMGGEEQKLSKNAKRRAKKKKQE